LAAAKAGRLTTEGKGNNDSVLELLDDAIRDYGDLEYYTKKSILTYKRKDKFHDADVTAYLRIIDGMTPDVKDKLSNWVNEKVGSGISKIKPDTQDKEMIREILLHILKINMKASDNPLAGIGRAPEASENHKGLKVNNPLFALRAVKPNIHHDANNAEAETPPPRSNRFASEDESSERTSFYKVPPRRH